MKIGIIGAGNVGTGLAKQLVPKGHSVMLSFSKDKAQLQGKAKALGATAGTVAEAVAFARRRRAVHTVRSDPRSPGASGAGR